MRRTRDSLWRGELVFQQPARGDGYRFNLDPVLLAGFAPSARHVVDLGAGVGVVGVLLLAAGKAERVTAVEIQPDLAELAAENARANGFADRLSVVTADLRTVRAADVDAVVFNPPYHKAVEGRGASERGRDAARHERHGTLADFVGWAAAATSAGFVCAIVPARRGPEIERLLVGSGLVALRRRPVLARPGLSPDRWLVEARHAQAAALNVEAPLTVHGPEGRAFSPEVCGLLREG